MFQTLRRHPLRVLSSVARDPLDTIAMLQDTIVARWEYPVTPCNADLDWEIQLHSLLSRVPNTTQRAEFETLWKTVVADLQARGMVVGPFSFHEWNDGDAGFVRAIWHILRTLQPSKVVETGVAHGMTSRFILEAMQLNDHGLLWSIDLPPHNPETRAEVGVAVRMGPPALAERWTYVAGTSRRRLPPMLNTLQTIDLFIHDSLHSGRNVAFELEWAWQHLRPGGFMVVDDIDVNSAFKSFADAHPNHPSLVCTAEPLRPDPRRFNQKGLFGIIRKRSSSNR